MKDFKVRYELGGNFLSTRSFSLTIFSKLLYPRWVTLLTKNQMSLGVICFFTLESRSTTFLSWTEALTLTRGEWFQGNDQELKHSAFTNRQGDNCLVSETSFEESSAKRLRWSTRQVSDLCSNWERRENSVITSTK